jgi:hypothetical protein
LGSPENGDFCPTEAKERKQKSPFSGETSDCSKRQQKREHLTNASALCVRTKSIFKIVRRNAPVPFYGANKSIVSFLGWSQKKKTKGGGHRFVIKSLGNRVSVSGDPEFNFFCFR